MNAKQRQAIADATPSPVQDAIQKVAMDPKLSNADIAAKVCKMVKGAHTSAKSVASQVRLMRKRGVNIPPRARSLPQPA